MLYVAAYLLAGVVVFFGLRAAFRKAKLDTKAHDSLWTHWLSEPEGWLFAILFWPVLAVASLAWFFADLLHASGKKELQRSEEIEAARDKKYDYLTLEQKIDRLEAEARKREPNKTSSGDS